MSPSCDWLQAKGIALEDRASLIQQASVFADPCTFRLIAKNVTNLLTQREANLKADANQSLDALLKYGESTIQRLELGQLSNTPGY